MWSSFCYVVSFFCCQARVSLCGIACMSSFRTTNLTSPVALDCMMQSKRMEIQIPYLCFALAQVRPVACIALQIVWIELARVCVCAGVA